MTSAVAQLTARDLERLAAVLTRRSGIAFPEARWPVLESRVRALMTRLLRETVLPALTRELRRASEPRPPILTVGCATGEEPYAIAMTVAEHVPADLAHRVEILALDEHGDVLAVARPATYPSSRVAAVPPALRCGYLARGSEGLGVVPAIRRMVRFLESTSLFDTDGLPGGFGYRRARFRCERGSVCHGG